MNFGTKVGRRDRNPLIPSFFCQSPSNLSPMVPTTGLSSKRGPKRTPQQVLAQKMPCHKAPKKPKRKSNGGLFGDVSPIEKKSPRSSSSSSSCLRSALSPPPPVFDGRTQTQNRRRSPYGGRSPSFAPEGMINRPGGGGPSIVQQRGHHLRDVIRGRSPRGESGAQAPPFPLQTPRTDGERVREEKKLLLTPRRAPPLKGPPVIIRAPLLGIAGLLQQVSAATPPAPASEAIVQETVVDTRVSDTLRSSNRTAPAAAQLADWSYPTGGTFSAAAGVAVAGGPKGADGAKPGSFLFCAGQPMKTGVVSPKPAPPKGGGEHSSDTKSSSQSALSAPVTGPPSNRGLEGRLSPRTTHANAVDATTAARASQRGCTTRAATSTTTNQTASPTKQFIRVEGCISPATPAFSTGNLRGGGGPHRANSLRDSDLIATSVQSPMPSIFTPQEGISIPLVLREEQSARRKLAAELRQADLLAKKEQCELLKLAKMKDKLEKVQAKTNLEKERSVKRADHLSREVEDQLHSVDDKIRFHNDKIREAERKKETLSQAAAHPGPVTLETLRARRSDAEDSDAVRGLREMNVVLLEYLKRGKRFRAVEIVAVCVEPYKQRTHI